MPLARWLNQTLGRLGVSVQTIDSVAKRALARREGVVLERKGFDDPEFFGAATSAIQRGEFDVVVVDEWQTTSPLERAFVDRVAEGALYLIVHDASRDLSAGALPPAGSPDRIELTTSLRSPGRVRDFDRALVDEQLEPWPAAEVKASVRLTALDREQDLARAAASAINALRSRGFAPSEIGVVSCLGRTASATVTGLVSARAAPRGFHLTTPQGMSDLAADSFAYWLGLERRAVIVVEASPAATCVRKRLHIALSRATEFAHLLLAREDVEGDPVFRKWPRERALR
jgi:hypothetical protein